MRQAEPRSRSLPGAVGAASLAIPSGSHPSLGSGWFDPFLDLYPEIAGTKNNPGVLLHAVSNSVGRKYDVQRVSAEGAKSNE